MLGGASNNMSRVRRVRFRQKQLQCRFIDP